MRNLNNTGVTLLEILLASVIFVVSVAGIFATINAVRTPVANKENALSAAVFGKQVLETLRTQVNAGGTYFGVCAGTCTTFDLQLGKHLVAMPLATPALSWPTTDLTNNNAAGLSYTVTCANSGSVAVCGADVARRVDLNISW